MNVGEYYGWFLWVGNRCFFAIYSRMHSTRLRRRGISISGHKKFISGIEKYESEMFRIISFPSIRPPFSPLYLSISHSLTPFPFAYI